MKIEKAIEILEDHNNWRRDRSEIPASPPKHTAEELGIAIETILDFAKGNIPPKIKEFEKGFKDCVNANDNESQVHRIDMNGKCFDCNKQVIPKQD